MTTYDLFTEGAFATKGPQKKLIHDSGEVRWALFCLEAGQEIPIHESPSRVSIAVMDGEGDFLGDGTPRPFTRGSLCVFGPDEPHGFRARTRSLIIAAITPRPE